MWIASVEELMKTKFGTDFLSEQKVLHLASFMFDAAFDDLLMM